LNLLEKIVTRIKGNDCQKLVQRTGQEIKITGLGIEAGGVDFNIGEFSNQIKELVRIPQISIDLDNTQYLLCDTISKLDTDKELKNKCIAIRLQLIVAFNQLSSILTSIKEEPTEELKKQLSKWLMYMEELHKHSISVLDPSKGETSKSSMPLPEILKYQQIDDSELSDAVNQYNA